MRNWEIWIEVTILLYSLKRYPNLGYVEAAPPTLPTENLEEFPESHISK